ncbi:hypothetical protein BDV93DRAFT_523573 [Ceratobasidium sp. AG-I]|nr:hypothetical protein BDV93DRAFT_523573 [Ceratobasidium sp. AG-I]
MSNSAYIVKASDVLLIPVASANNLAPVAVEWDQPSDKKGSYHTGLVQVKGQTSNYVLFFIESEWYTDGSSLPSAHISKVSPKVGGFYELAVDEKVRFGQQNPQGENRFIVYHDTTRNPPQHSFVTPALRVTTQGLGSKLASRMGVTQDMIKDGSSQLNTIFGGALHKF